MSHTYTSAFLWVLTIGTAAISTADVEAGWFFRGRGFRPTTKVQYTVPASVVNASLPSVAAGSTITFPSSVLGPETGSAFMVFQDIKLPARIDSWTESSVTVTLPTMNVRHPLRVAVDVVTPQGKLAIRKPMLITPPSELIFHPGSSQSRLPTNSALIEQNRLPAGN